MSQVSVLLIEKNAFLREGLRSLLVQSGYDPVFDVPSVRDVQREGLSFDLVVQGIDDARDRISERLAYLKSCFTRAKIIILSPTLDPSLIRESFSFGADGFMLKDISGKAFLGSLHLVMLGEKVFPTSMASLLIRGWGNWTSNDMFRGGEDYRLSAREIEIVKCLSRGDTNKEIARTLEITESTVKVHLKTILRKLKLTNRTQAAIWAIRQGFIPANRNIALLDDGDDRDNTETRSA